MSQTVEHNNKTNGTPHTPTVIETLYPTEITPSKYRHLLPNPKPHRFNEVHANLVFNYIEEQIAVYGISLAVLCKEPLTVGRVTFFKWIKENENLMNRYARAVRCRTDLWAEQIIEIADNSNLDAVLDRFGNIQIIGEAVQRSRVRIDSRKWLMAKLNPIKYGDRVAHEITGHAGGSIKVEAIDYSKLSDKALREILKATNKPSESGASEISI